MLPVLSANCSRGLLLVLVRPALVSLKSEVSYFSKEKDLWKTWNSKAEVKVFKERRGRKTECVSVKHSDLYTAGGLCSKGRRTWGKGYESLLSATKCLAYGLELGFWKVAVRNSAFERELTYKSGKHMKMILRGLECAVSSSDLAVAYWIT